MDFDVLTEKLFWDGVVKRKQGRCGENNLLLRSPWVLQALSEYKLNHDE